MDYRLLLCYNSIDISEHNTIQLQSSFKAVSKQFQSRNTLKYISMQDYEGVLNVIVVDNASTDRTSEAALAALKVVKPWQHPIGFVKYLTTINLIMPFLDIVYTYAWIPGLLLAAFGIYWVVGPTTLFVLPLALMQNYILYRYQRNVFRVLNLKIRKNRLGFVIFVFAYQILMSPISVLGYFQELFFLKRVWK